MKKFFLVFGLTLFLVSCGGNASSDNKTSDDPNVSLGNSFTTFEIVYDYLSGAMEELNGAPSSYNVAEIVEESVACNVSGTAYFKLDTNTQEPTAFGFTNCKSEITNLGEVCSMDEIPEVTIDGELTYTATDTNMTFEGSLVLTGSLEFTCVVELTSPLAEEGPPDLEDMTGTICGENFEDILDLRTEIYENSSLWGEDTQTLIDDFCASLE